MLPRIRNIRHGLAHISALRSLTQPLQLAILARKRTRACLVPVHIAHLEDVIVQIRQVIIHNPLLAIQRHELAALAQHLGWRVAALVPVADRLVELLRAPDAVIAGAAVVRGQRAELTGAGETEQVLELLLSLAVGAAGEVREGELLAGGDRADRVHGLFLERWIPGVLCVGTTAMVDAGDVCEDAAHVGAGTQGVAVRADDVTERVLAGIVIVQRQVSALGLLGEGLQSAREILLGALDGLDHVRRDQGRVA